MQAWQSAVPRDVLEGLLASEELRNTHNLHGVAGCLVDLMDVPPQLVTAADVVAGNQLFQACTKPQPPALYAEGGTASRISDSCQGSYQPAITDRQLV